MYRARMILPLGVVVGRLLLAGRGHLALTSHSTRQTASDRATTCAELDANTSPDESSPQAANCYIFNSNKYSRHWVEHLEHRDFLRCSTKKKRKHIKIKNLPRMEHRNTWNTTQIQVAYDNRSRMFQTWCFCYPLQAARTPARSAAMASNLSAHHCISSRRWARYCALL